MIARWYLEYLYLMGHGTATVAKKKEVWDKLVIGNADAGSNAPIHYMVSSSGTFYSTAGSDVVTGRVLSIEDGREWWATYGGNEDSITPLPYVCSSSPCDGRLNADSATYRNRWTADATTDYTTHAPSFNAIPYLLTGYHYYLVGAQMEGAFTMSTTTSDVNSSGKLGRRMFGRGIVYDPDVPRATAWGHRNIFLAALVSPDGTVEKAYFKNRLQNNAAFMEGVMMLTTGAYTPADQTCASWTRPTSISTARTAGMWCAGRDTWGLQSGMPTPAANAAFVPMYGYIQSSNDGLVNGYRRVPVYMLHYIANVWGWIANTEAFLDVDSQPVFAHVANGMAAHYAGRVLSSVNSMYQFRAWEVSVGIGTAPFCPTIADCASAAIYSWQLDANMTNSQTTLDVVAASDFVEGGSGFFNQAYALIDNEYVRLTGSPALNTPSSGKARFTISRRGVWGSTAATHTAGATVYLKPLNWDNYLGELQGGPAILARSALAMLAERTQIGDYSPAQAYARYSGALTYQNLYVNNPQWATTPAERIQSVTATGGTGTATLTWLAPDGGQCHVHLGSTPPASSQDGDGETVDTSKGRRQSVSATGLSAGTNYYRITCGVARVSGTVTVN
jgi:hypothetical protein